MTDPQPGRRPPAPGQLAVVQAFLNTHFDLGPRWGLEVLHDAPALSAWLHAHGLGGARPAATPEDLGRALVLRAALRGAVRSPRDPDVLRRLSAGAADAPATVHFGPGGPRFAAGPGIDGGLGALAAIAAGAMLHGTWERLKLCPGEHCGWAFYDQSRNRSGRWCSMSVCGARTKARAHYARRRGRT